MSSLHVLLLSGDPTTQDVFEGLGAPVRHEVTAVDTTGEVEEALRLCHYGALAVDLQQPHANDPEWIRRVREMEPGLALLLLSPYANLGEVPALLEAGGDGFALKPLSESMAEVALRRALERRRALSRQVLTEELVAAKDGLESLILEEVSQRIAEIADEINRLRGVMGAPIDPNAKVAMADLDLSLRKLHQILDGLEAVRAAIQPGEDGPDDAMPWERASA